MKLILAVIVCSCSYFYAIGQYCDGTLFNFGADNPANQTYNMEVQNSLTFRIITEEADVTDIENENIN